jgi:quinol monooxygenase YgiN
MFIALIDMYLAIIKIYPSPGNEHIVVDVLESMKGQISAMTDCDGCSVSVEVGEGGAVCYTEWWRDREALDQHLRSALYTRVLATMELSFMPPVVEFFEATKAGGLNLVETARALQ